MTATSFTKRQCTVTPNAGGAATTLTFAGSSPYTTDTVKSGPVFTAGTYTTDVSIMYTENSNSVTWDDSASQTAVVSSSATSVTTSHTMTNSGVRSKMTILINFEALLFLQPYKLTCTLSSTYDLSTTGADSRYCLVTAESGSTFTGSPLTLTVPDGQSSVTSDPIFTSGTQVSVDGFLTVTSTNIGWDADAQTITMSSDMTTTLTLTESGERVSSLIKHR